jgi:hypothetical protein
MALRVLFLVLMVACGGSQKPDEPTTAREKQLREAKDKDPDANEKSWGKWRYTGERGKCFYQVKGKCFKTEKAACAAAKCKAPKKCNVVGGGPASIQCK